MGAAERGRLLPRPGVEPGDAVVGPPSSGIHSNGFSLVRRIVANTGLGWTDPAPFEPTRTLAEALLVPTRIYVRTLLGIALDGGAWTPPPVFGWLARTGGVADPEMLRTFNCGIGLVAVVRRAALAATMAAFADAGESAVEIGEVVAATGPRRVTMRGPVTFA